MVASPAKAYVDSLKLGAGGFCPATLRPSLLVPGQKRPQHIWRSFPETSGLAPSRRNGLLHEGPLGTCCRRSADIRLASTIPARCRYPAFLSDTSRECAHRGGGWPQRKVRYM